MVPCNTVYRAPFDSVCSGCLVSVPSDRYNGIIGALFSCMYHTPRRIIHKNKSSKSDSSKSFMSSDSFSVTFQFLLT